ncbi:hypothetical protein NBRC110019_21300 [Neptunitalea chrysea]|uniref:Tetratricopeptide repeat-containing protein n=1 Tax=Neptunitalea chrysea TaxID=1647581 RepID=A0A9W6EU61_9FLAO|nr:tetratricopeptide repeat protein [Neptunitalea chrysea]GLB53090.1 hypothetical protein NBRC110019_21300 [Neptunitalea chrysea]
MSRNYKPGFGIGASAQAMIDSFRNNQIMRSKHRNLSKDHQTRLDGLTQYAHTKLHFSNTATSEDLKAIKQKIEKQQRKASAFKIITLSIIALVATVLFAIKIYEAKVEGLENLQKEAALEKRQYTTYITNGHTYLEAQKWDKAYYEFKQALEIVPNDAYAYYGIALTRATQCELTFTYCNNAKYWANFFIDKFPENTQQIADLKSHLTYEFSN